MTRKYKTVNGKTIIGLTEPIIITGVNKIKKRLKAKIDTGADISSIDSSLAAELKLGPIIRTKLIKSSHGNSMRPVVKASIKIANKRFKYKFTIADRKHLRYRVLIGRNILKNKFLIDPDKK